MAQKVLSESSKKLISYLMEDETIANKVKSAGEEGKTYVIYSVKDSGKIVLGETTNRFWNRLIKCQFPLTFEAFASCVWDALVDLSTGGNQEALLKGLSKEVMEKAQREKKYDWIVERLFDCYRHVCNNKGGAEVDTEVSLGKSGLNVGSKRVVVQNDTDQINVNINVDGHKRTLRFPDATGEAFLDVEMGVTGVRVSKG